MNCLEHFKNSPALQLLKQLDTPLSIATKTAAQFDWLSNDAPLIAAMKAAQQDWTRDISSMAAAWKSAQAAVAFHTTPIERAIEVIQRDWARDISLMETAWNSAQHTLALEAAVGAKAIDAYRQDLARDTVSMATAWMTAQAAWTLDSAPIATALKAADVHNLRIVPAWAASISLERVQPPKAVIVLTENSPSNKPFSDCGMETSYDLLSDFERDLRHFIHQRMSAAFGSNWEKNRLPRHMYQGWQEKREKAILAGESPGRLIDYADFTDYVTVISRRDNWEQLFRSCFGRAQSVQESLYRLQPIRVCIMHARVLSQEMRLLLQSEIMLLSKRMWS